MHVTRAARDEDRWSARFAALALLSTLFSLCIAPSGCTTTGGEPASPAVLNHSADLDDGPAEEAWVFQGVTGQLIRTPNYRIHLTTDNRLLVERFPAFMEDLLAHYRVALAPLPAPPGRMDSFLFADRFQWEAFTQELMGSRASRYLQIQRGGYATGGRAVFWDIGLYDTFAIAAHEGWHQYTQKTFAESLPVWLEEGIATYMEGHRFQDGAASLQPWTNWERFDQLRRAYYSDRLMPLSELLTAQPEYMLAAGEWETQPDEGDDRGSRRTRGRRPGPPVLVYYAQVWALTHFLHEGEDGKYRERLRMLLLDAAEGRVRDRVAASLRTRRSEPPSGRAPLPEMSDSAAAVFHVYFSDDPAAIQVEYEAFVAKAVAPGSRQLIFQGKSPVAGE